MEEYAWKSPHDGRMRARVHQRKRRAVQMEGLRWELEETARPMAGVLELARQAQGPRISLKAVVMFIAAAALVLCGVVFLPNLKLSASKPVVKAAPKATSTPVNTTMAEMQLLSRVNPPQKPVRILVLGSDKRSDDPSFRTDVIMLVTVDGAKNQVSAVSFPRDLIAKIPGYGENRVNLIMQFGGFSLMQDTLEQNFGARPDYYFMTNFDGFASLINSIGGVEVNVEQPLEDACDLNWSKAGQCEMLPGKHSMDGATALWYIRSRHTSSDFDRLRRAQEVMVGIFSRFMNMHAILRLPELYKQYSQDVETNMEVKSILSLMPTAAQVIRNPKRIHRYAITPNEATDFWTAEGAEVLLPNYEAIQAIIRKASFE